MGGVEGGVKSTAEKVAAVCRGARSGIATLTIIIHLSSRKLFSYVRTKETIVKGIVRSLASFIVSHGLNQFDKSHGQIIRENYPINLIYVYTSPCAAELSREERDTSSSTKSNRSETRVRIDHCAAVTSERKGRCFKVQNISDIFSIATNMGCFQKFVGFLAILF